LPKIISCQQTLDTIAELEITVQQFKQIIRKAVKKKGCCGGVCREYTKMFGTDE
jgi:hypothetical protein